MLKLVVVAVALVLAMLCAVRVVAPATPVVPEPTFGDPPPPLG
jgi:hypothetical protein